MSDERMETDEASMLWEALEKTPRLPTYATRAIDRLKAEFWRTRNAETTGIHSLDAIRQALQDHDQED